METWTKLSDHSSDNETTNDTEIGDEPIDLKQIDHADDHNRRGESNDWKTLRLIKAKAFSIKDILGLDEKEKQRSTYSDSNVSDQRKLSNEMLLESSEYRQIAFSFRNQYSAESIRNEKRSAVCLLMLIKNIPLAFLHLWFFFINALCKPHCLQSVTYNWTNS